MTELEKLENELTALQETYDERDIVARAAHERLFDFEQRLSVLDGAQRGDHLALQALTEDSSLEDVVVIQTRLAARPVLVGKTKDAVDAARAQFKMKEAHRDQLNRPLSELRNRVGTIKETIRRQREEKLRIEITRRVEAEVEAALEREAELARAQPLDAQSRGRSAASDKARR